MVFTNAKNKELAAEFIAHMTNKDNVATMAQFFPPARKSVLGSAAFTEANKLIPAEQMAGVSAAIEEGTVLFPPLAEMAVGVVAGFGVGRLCEPGIVAEGHVFAPDVVAEAEVAAQQLDQVRRRFARQDHSGFDRRLRHHAT